MRATPDHTTTASARDSGEVRVLRSPIQEALEELHGRIAAEPPAGAVASYIPELSHADASHFGIVLATADGHCYRVGDTDIAFTIQSISKLFVYGLALEELGMDETAAAVGVEPSGDRFNAISLDSDSGRPYNPMINAGAIACANLMHRLHGATAFDHVLRAFSQFAGKKLELDEPVYRSESCTGHRNRAIGHLLRNFDVLEGHVDSVLDVYFRQCSIRVTCNDLAMMGATLANRGEHPRSGRRLLSPRNVTRVLSIMSSCGMYDYSGEWGFRVGLPAKSGVGGGILAVLPGQFAVAVFSPPLDPHGNSVRGIRVCEELTDRFGLHLLSTPRMSGFAIRKDFSPAELRSRRRWRPEQMRKLDAHRHRIRLLQLQGELGFFTVEPVLRSIMERAQDTRFVVLDLERAHAIDDSGIALLLQLAHTLAETGRMLLLVRCRHLSALLFALAGDSRGAGPAIVDDASEALEVCEIELLQELDEQGLSLGELPLPTQRLFEDFTPRDMQLLAPLLTREDYEPGALIVREGEPAFDLFFLARGRVSVLLGDPRRPSAVLARIEAGLCFGEMALVDDKPRSATVRADSRTVCYRLPYAALDQPSLAELRRKLLVNLARDLSARLRSANAQILRLL